MRIYIDEDAKKMVYQDENQRNRFMDKLIMLNRKLKIIERKPVEHEIYDENVY